MRCCITRICGSAFWHGKLLYRSGDIMNAEAVVHPFPPLYSSDSETLILGSFPSVRSREAMFFYGHPQNRFWKVTALLYNEKVPDTIEEKKRLILNHSLALWDSIHSCTVTGSSDSSIRDVVPNDISIILSGSRVNRIFCNGALSHRRKSFLPQARQMLLILSKDWSGSGSV